jgi:acyl carrier protein
MSLPQPTIDFLNDSASSNGAHQPGAADDLFELGVLDSFALVDFVTVLEQHCGIKVPDPDITPANFRTIDTIERYVSARVS